MWCVGVIRVDFSKHFTLVARMSIQEAAEAVAAATEFENQPNEELSINEEYQLWRKNCRYMYEFVSETALTWPSLTIQWLPEHTIEGDAYESTLLLGTHTSGEDTNYLKIANTQIPVSSSGDKPMSRLKITKKFANNHEINREGSISTTEPTIPRLQNSIIHPTTRMDTGFLGTHISRDIYLRLQTTNRQLSATTQKLQPMKRRFLKRLHTTI